eukprot:CAMPEP_0180619594 /NCGR_PEP_ID=MMETSP1037_2-20121125/34174_1 /TAXON_ID=632150 /ORGANISM="Azadinium spinosum, Strain 3D9" /LENGTH=62 /DNA_ID=CAMNT_0022639665 /DNA_START=224 /DNA_END=412 /DNA_ORIENTATION=+
MAEPFFCVTTEQAGGSFGSETVLLVKCVACMPTEEAAAKHSAALLTSVPVAASTHVPDSLRV